MKDKGHFYISLVKSVIRMLSCVASVWFLYNSIFCAIPNGIMYFFIAIASVPVGFFIAELLGVAEEIFDKRV